jgi:wobble nucleotide-excising tRNase
MITSLNIKDVATFDPENGVQINDLKKVNFFFGFNGSGKSTIGTYLHNLSVEQSKKNSDFLNCSNVGFDDAQYQILTFNEDFVEDNFISNSELKGIFSLNESNDIIDQQILDEELKIESFQTQIEKNKTRIENFDKDKVSKNEDLIKHCWSQRNTFESFTKISLAHSGSKPNHFEEIKKRLSNPLTYIQSIDDLTSRYQTLYEEELKEINVNVDAKAYLELRRLEVQLESLLEAIIIGNEDVDIAGLIQSYNSRSWVEQGLKFIENNNTTCPFCQNETIDAELREQFGKFFDKTYKEKIAEIESLKSIYRSKGQVLISNLNIIQDEYNSKNKVSNVVIALTEMLKTNLETIQHKIDNSNERKSINTIASKKNELSEIIKLINDNNKLYSDLDKNREKLLIDIWNYMANSCQKEVSDFDLIEPKYPRLTTLAKLLISKYENKIVTSKEEIEKLRSETVDTKVAVENINTILNNAGFGGFEIAEKEKINNISKYYLKRQENEFGKPVFKSLSEGEKNFIAFLYFHQLCIGSDDLQNNGAKKKIIVIDDPVSSLDSQSLFFITTLIRELIQRKGNKTKPEIQELLNTNIAQAFILTHNFYFYKEVSFDKRIICTNHIHYHIKKINNKTQISGQHERVIKDDYSLLWTTLKEIKSDNQVTSASNILISNTMRRILESFVNFIGLGNDSWSAILIEEKEEPNYYIKYAFISTINDESHKVSALDSIYYQKIINEQPQILFDIFLSIFRTIGKQHYEMMMEEEIQELICPAKS